MPINQVVRGVLNGTGAIVNVCLGFIPTWVKISNIEDAGNYYSNVTQWDKNMHTILLKEEGVKLLVLNDTDADATALTTAQGIKAYAGGDVADGTETYLTRDPAPDKRDKGAGVAIDTWTLDTPANRTGHWNAVCSLTYPNNVGIGSVIRIDSGAGMKEYWIQAISNNGAAANEVTLNAAAPAGKIGFLGGIYTFVQGTSGLITPAGFTLAADADVNVNDETIIFEAGH